MHQRATRGTTIVLAAALIATSISAASAQENWPTWRGPNGTGAVAGANPPTTWSETENIKWKVEIPGLGQSSPVIWGNKIFFQTAIDAGNGQNAYKFDILCLDRATGKTLWQKTAIEAVPHEGHHSTGSLAAYSPITDGKLLWASFGSRGLYCYDLDGNLKWSRPLIKMTIVAGFGEGSSPCLAGDAIVVVCDHEGQSKIFAFNKETGEPLWEKDRDEGTSWASPVAAEVNGKIQVITSATNFIRSYDAKTGEVIWQCSGMTRNAIPTGIVAFDTALCISGFGGSSLMAIELDSTGDVSGTDAVVWKMSDGTPYVPSPVLMGERLFFCGSSNNQAIVSCYNAKTGAAIFSKQRLQGANTLYASFVGAGDHIYIPARNGVVSVIKNADTFEIVAANKLDDTFDATPAVIGNELYLRGAKNFYCIAQQ